MDENVLNQQVRSFLKRTGINAQREIENGVREAIAAGRLSGDEKLSVSMTLRVSGLDLESVIDGEIALE